MRFCRVNPQSGRPGGRPGPPLQGRGGVLQNAPMSAPRPRRTALAGLAALVLLGACATPARPPAAVTRADPVEAAYPDEGHEHIPFPAFPHAPYGSNPPTSGPHTPYVAPWGVHDKPVANEVLVHNLEHGGVVLGYRCADCPDVVKALTALAEGYPMVVVAPNPDLPAPVVASAWRHTLAVQRLDAQGRRAIAAFLARHHGVDHHAAGPHTHTAPPEPAP
jgi:hypothetical protein